MPRILIEARSASPCRFESDTITAMDGAACDVRLEGAPTHAGAWRDSRSTISRLAAWTLAAGCLVAGGCRKPPEAPAKDAYADWTPTVQPLSSPVSGTATTPQLTANGDRTILSWLERANARTSLKFAERTASGWSDARLVSSGADFVTNAADVPSVRAAGDRRLVAHWNQQYGEDPEAYSLLLSWSSDDGRGWSAPVSPHHDTTKTQHGFGSLFDAPGGGFGVIWLDGRTTNPTNPDDPNGTMALWAAVYDAGGRQVSEAPIDPRVCDCCQTSVAETSDGPIVAYRDRSAAEVRDIAVTRFAGGRWSPPAPVHADGWTINGCPVNGPAIDARGRHVAVAWFTAGSGDGRALVAFSDDAGRTFAEPVRVDDAACSGHVDVELLSDGSAAVSWTERADERAQVKLRRIQPGGNRSPSVRVAEVSSAEYPRLAHAPGELLLTWSETENGYSHVRVARVALPAN
jgi:hypothetical protein